MNAAKFTLTSTMLAAALGLALVFSVSSVEARKLCEPCQKCDVDGDGYIQDRDFCTNKCGVGLGADDDDNDPLIPDLSNTDMCPVDDGSFTSIFQVTLTGPVTGGPDFFNGSTSDGRFITLPVFNPLGMALDLSFFAGMGDGSDLCFPNDNPPNMTTLFAALLESKNIKGGGNLQAIGKFWFEGETSVEDDGIVVSYVFDLLGTFLEPNWPDNNTLTMTDWIMKVETTKKGGRKIACTSEGSFFGEGEANVIINVVKTQ